MKDGLAVEDKRSCLEKIEEEIKYENEKEQAAAQCLSTEETYCFASPAPEVVECRRIDAVANTMDISDSELLYEKQKKPHVLDALFALDDVESVDENATGSVLPETPTSSSSAHTAADVTTVPPPSESPVRPTDVDANSFLRAVRSFPLPLGQPHRPVVGPPSLDQDMLRRMEQLHIPVSLPQEDVERVARLEQLKQLSCM